MTMSENSPIQINFKTKKDGMLINLRATDGAELDLLLDQLTQRLAALVDLEKTVEGMAVVKDAFPNSVPVQGTTVAPRPVQTAPAGAPDCACGAGAMRFVPAGIAKSTGRPYKAFYACPKPQGQACQHKVTV
jgi:hypothetical protein